MSKLSDVAGTEEDNGKGRTPKELVSCGMNSWAYDEESYDCHLVEQADGALSEICYTGSGDSSTGY